MKFSMPGAAHHHRAARVAGGGDEGGLAEKIERVAAEQRAVVIGVMWKDELDEAGFGRARPWRCRGHLRRSLA